MRDCFLEKISDNVFLSFFLFLVCVCVCALTAISQTSVHVESRKSAFKVLDSDSDSGLTVSQHSNVFAVNHFRV